MSTKLILSLIGVVFFMSCSNSDNPDIPQEYTGMPLIILDTDIGSSTDDLFALEMLYLYEEQGLCRLLGVVVDREGEQNAVFTDVMNTYFGHEDVPIGLVRKGIDNPKVWIDYAHVADILDGNGQPMFQRTVTDYSTLYPMSSKIFLANEYSDLLLLFYFRTNFFSKYLQSSEILSIFATKLV